MKKVFYILSIILLLNLISCSSITTKTSNKTEGLDLSGEWIQVDANKEDVYQKAIIKDNIIEIFWISKEDNTECLYWAGDYKKAENNPKTYSWDSINDKEKTSFAILASPDDMKTFKYENGKISYEVSAFGITKEFKLKRNK